MLKNWNEMRLRPAHPSFTTQVGGDGAQLCNGELIRHRTLTGICNDISNPAMGSTGQLFARNVEFEGTFPDAGANDSRKNRHGDRLGLLKPDPQVISRKLFTRDQTEARELQPGAWCADSADADCVPEGAVLQRARGVLDPVHDARLVLAPRGGAQRPVARS